ncbi:uncharacterized protein METZ01_LOCUS423790, partial [marine metagenome]
VLSRISIERLDSSDRRSWTPADDLFGIDREHRSRPGPDNSNEVDFLRSERALRPQPGTGRVG